MSAIVYKVGKGGVSAKAGVVPANHSEEAHFGLVDGVIVSVGVLLVGGLVCLVLLLG